MRKPIAVLLSMLLLITIFCVGCNKQSEKTATDTVANKIADESNTRTITDANGQVVEVPKDVQKIAITCQGGVTHELVVLGAADMIVAQPNMGKFPFLLKMEPQFKNVVDAGSFDNVNVEELLKLEPDIVFGGITGQKGNSKIKEAGIPVATMLTGRGNIEQHKNEFLVTGSILGKNDEAKRLVAYWDEKLKLINDRVSQIPDGQRKKVYYARNQMLETEGSDWWGDILITTAGGQNVARNLGIERNISLEQLIKWNPDVMLISNVQGKDSGSITLDEIQNDKQLANITAVKQGQTYICPIGSFWWDRPCPEAPLGFMWLAKILYPDLTQDIDLEKETKYFYKKFYEYDLSDEEYESFF